MFARSTFVTILFAALASLYINVEQVSAHGALTSVNGANGVTKPGLGIDESTPRDGSRPNPFEQDTSIIRDKEIASGKTGPCGRTKLGGNNDVATQLTAIAAGGLPTADSSGVVSMTLHQVNQDGAGPYKASISADGTGTDFVDATVTQNVPGFLSLSRTTATDFEVKVQMPAGMNCTGGPDGNACLVRLRNSALAGPFGGCGAFTTGGAAAKRAPLWDEQPQEESKRDTVQDDDVQPLKKRALTSRFVGRENAGKWI